MMAVSRSRWWGLHPGEEWSVTDCDASRVLAAIRSRTQEPRFARLRRQRGALFEGRMDRERLKLVYLRAREFRVEAWSPVARETRVRVRFAPGRVLINILLLAVAATGFHYLDALAAAGAVPGSARLVPPAVAAAILGIEYLTLRHVSRRVIGLIHRSLEALPMADSPGTDPDLSVPYDSGQESDRR